MKFHNYFEAALSQSCFEFVHPNLLHPNCPNRQNNRKKEENNIEEKIVQVDDVQAGIDNSRYKTLKFRMNIDCVIHGLAGYFESKLFDDVSISLENKEQIDQIKNSKIQKSKI